MKKLLLFILSLALFGCSTITTKNAGSPGPAINFTPVEEVKKETIDWQPFSDDLIKVSVALDKTVFVYIGDKDCEFCKMMDDTTFSNEIVVDFINRKLIATSIDTTDNPRAAAIFYDDGEISIPKFVFIRPREDGRWIVVEAIGYMNPFKMLELIRYAEKHIKSKLDEDNSHEEGIGEYKSVPAK